MNKNEWLALLLVLTRVTTFAILNTKRKNIKFSRDVKGKVNSKGPKARH